MFWNPEKAVTHEHHLHTEEEVFKFCLENKFYFPNHLEGNEIVFVGSLLKDSKLLENMQDFWEKWVGFPQLSYPQSCLADTAEQRMIVQLHVNRIPGSGTFWKPSLV
jgi:hypothetical protein